VRLLARLPAFVLVAFCASCASSSEPAPAASDASAPDVPVPADASAPPSAALTGECAGAFGRALTPGFGRIDGVVYAVQKPSDTACVMPDDERVVVQVLMGSAVYRMVVDVHGDQVRREPEVRFASVIRPLPQPPYYEGWRTDVSLDYATMLDVHADDADFAPRAAGELVSEIASLLPIGQPVSVYAHAGEGGGETADRIHRSTQSPGEDGAIVVGPTGPSPRFLLFHFDGQTF
jgi:hypothetical protein